MKNDHHTTNHPFKVIFNDELSFPCTQWIVVFDKNVINLELGMNMYFIGLFHKAVFMCGYAFNCVALEQENYALEYAFKFGRWLGFTGKNSKALLEFYKKLPAEIFQNNMKDFMRNSLKVNYSLLLLAESTDCATDSNLRMFMLQNSVISFPCGIFRPSIDKGKNAVLPMFPRKLIPTIQRIPLMVGICDHEGVMGFTGEFILLRFVTLRYHSASPIIFV